MSKSTRKQRISKPDKPYPDFPLFAHATRRWAKKIRGKLHYFGPWDDPEGALQRYLDQRDDLHAGRTPRVTGDGLTVRGLANRFLSEKRALAANGELTRRAWEDYYRTCERLVSVFGRERLVIDLAAEDFSRLRQDFSKTHGSWALAGDITRTCSVFKYAYEAGLIDQPVRYGPAFKRPPARKFRAERNGKGPRMFEAHEVRRLLDAAGQPMRAMILLAANCGLGNSDVGGLEFRHVDLENGWLDYPRPKTGIGRRCPLWPETVAALQEWLVVRPNPKPGSEGLDELVFLTAKGNPWLDRPSAKKPERLMGDRPVSKEFSKLMDHCGLHRPGRGFYALRHGFQTVGDESRDFVAVRKIMGHTFGGDISDMYRERISDERLRAVAEHVRRWLFGQTVDPTVEGGRRRAHDGTHRIGC